MENISTNKVDNAPEPIVFEAPMDNGETFSINITSLVHSVMPIETGSLFVTFTMQGLMNGRVSIDLAQYQ